MKRSTKKKLNAFSMKCTFLAPVKYVWHLLNKWDAAKAKATEICGEENVTPKLISHMLWALARYYYRFDEYFMLDFEGTSKKKRNSYIPFYEQEYWIRPLLRKENFHFFANKNETYEMFGKYYKRTVMLLPKHCEDRAERFLEFVKAHPHFIVKLSNSSCGIGAQIFNIQDCKMTPQELYEQVICSYDQDLVLEDVIHQSEKMAAFYPKSVNTIRAITIRMDDRVEILPSVLRIGQGGAIVDNATAGGIMCAVDNKTGLTTAALDEKNHRFILHPDTKHPLIGQSIPEWENLLALLHELPYVIPENRFVGWDLAHTDDGWVVVEANSLGELIFQYPSGQGYRAQMKEIFKELGLKPFKR